VEDVFFMLAFIYFGWTKQFTFIDAETNLNGILATFNIGFRF